jgi:hypothetical protein
MNVGGPDYTYGRGKQIFQKSRCHLKILGAKGVAVYQVP